MIARDVTFHVGGLDGWAVGELVWCRGLVPPVSGRPVLAEVLAASRADLVLDGSAWPWPKLWFCKVGEGGASFQLQDRLVVAAAEMLLSPDGSARARPRPA